MGLHSGGEVPLGLVTQPGKNLGGLRAARVWARHAHAVPPPPRVRAPRPRPRAPRALTLLFRADHAAPAVRTTLGACMGASARTLRSRTRALLVYVCRARCWTPPRRHVALRRRVRATQAPSPSAVNRASCRNSHHRSAPGVSVALPKYSPVAARAGERRAARCGARPPDMILAHVLPCPVGTLARPPPVIGRVWRYKFSQWCRVARRTVCALGEVHSARCVCARRCAVVRGLDDSVWVSPAPSTPHACVRACTGVRGAMMTPGLVPWTA
jgi:hypothetical protein